MEGLNICSCGGTFTGDRALPGTKFPAVVGYMGIFSSWRLKLFKFALLH